MSADGVAPSKFRDTLGMTVTECVPGRAVVAVAADPRLSNIVGRLHGGVVASAVDTAGTLAGCRMTDGTMRSALTLSMTVNYIASPSGGIRAVAEVRGGGRQIFNSTVEVFDEAGALIAIGQANYKYIKD